MALVIIILFIITVLGAVLAYLFGKGKSKRRKYMIWGFALMMSISPALSLAIDLTYATITGNDWLSIIWYLFAIGFIIGLVMLIYGFFKKEEA